MKVILLDTIDRLGKMGDVVSVKAGFARNFLFPYKKAKAATPGNMKTLDSLKKKQAAIEEGRKKEVSLIADKIAALSLTISQKAGEEDKLFGSVTSEMIAQALAGEGISVDKKDIILDEPIKKLGSYQIAVKLPLEIKAALRIWVVNEAGSPQADS